MPKRKRSAITTKQAEAIIHLARASKTIQKSTISRASKQLILALCEGAINIIKGNVRLTTSQFHKLAPYQREVRHLAKPGSDWKEKREFLRKQSGGFLGLLLKPLAGLLGGLLGGIR